jgi:hypothetical protein
MEDRVPKRSFPFEQFAFTSSEYSTRIAELHDMAEAVWKHLQEMRQKITVELSINQAEAGITKQGRDGQPSAVIRLNSRARGSSGIRSFFIMRQKRLARFDAARENPAWRNAAAHAAKVLRLRQSITKVLVLISQP